MQMTVPGKEGDGVVQSHQTCDEEEKENFVSARKRNFQIAAAANSFVIGDEQKKKSAQSLMHAAPSESGK